MGFFRRNPQERVVDLPKVYVQTYERCLNLDRGELIVWAETMAINVDRLVHEYKESGDPLKAHDAYHHASQLVGMVRALAERSET